MYKKKIAYVGGTQAGKDVLKGLLDIGANIVGAFCWSEEKKKIISGYTDYSDIGEKYNFPVFKIDNINSKESIKNMQNIEPDYIFVMAWSQLLQRKLLDIPNEGTIGRHNALLPKRRGRAPVAWALIDGLEETGVTLFWIEEGIDSGGIISQKKVKIDFKDTAQDLLNKINDATVELLKVLLPKLEKGVHPSSPQKEEESTYTKKRTPEMGKIDWTKSATKLYNFIRGITHPYPGAFTFFEGEKIRIWQSKIAEKTAKKGKPGEIIKKTDDMILVQTGEGILELNISSQKLKKGDVLGE